MTRRRPGSYSITSYVYARVRPRNLATKSSRAPTPNGGGVCHCTEEILAYHCGAWDGSVAYAATCSHGRAMTTSVSTSTAMPSSSHVERRWAVGADAEASGRNRGVTVGASPTLI